MMLQTRLHASPRQPRPPLQAASYRSSPELLPITRAWLYLRLGPDS